MMERLTTGPFTVVMMAVFVGLLLLTAHPILLLVIGLGLVVMFGLTWLAVWILTARENHP